MDPRWGSGEEKCSQRTLAIVPPFTPNRACSNVHLSEEPHFPIIMLAAMVLGEDNIYLRLSIHDDMTIYSRHATVIFSITVECVIFSSLLEPKVHKAINNEIAGVYAASSPSAIHQGSKTAFRNRIVLRGVVSRGIEYVLLAKFQEREVDFVVGFQFSESVYVLILDQSPMIIRVIEPLELQQESVKYYSIRQHSKLTMPNAKLPKTTERSLLNFCEISWVYISTTT